MKSRRVLFAVLPAVLGLGLAGVGAAGPAGAIPVPGGFTCTGNFSNYPVNAEVIPAGTYSSLTLPPGSACGIAGQVVVNGPVTLGRASGLGLVSGGSLTVNGPVTVGHDAAFGPLGVLAPINVNGPLLIGPDGFVGLDSGGVSGPVLASAPSGLELYSIHVGGSVQILGGGGQNPVEELLYPTTPYRFTDLEGDVIAGPVTEIGYTGTGSSYGYGGAFIANQTGPMTLIGNTVAPIAVEANVIHGPATCFGNNPPPQDFGSSTVTGPILGSQGHLCFG